MLYLSLASSAQPSFIPVPHTVREELDIYERRILTAMVEQAIDDANLPLIDGRRSSTSAAAIAWLFSSKENPFSFRWICRVFGVSADLAQESVAERLGHVYIPNRRAH